VRVLFHELRSPMQSAFLAIDELSAMGLQPDAAEVLAVAVVNVRFLGRLMVRRRGLSASVHVTSLTAAAVVARVVAVEV